MAEVKEAGFKKFAELVRKSNREDRLKMTENNNLNNFSLDNILDLLEEYHRLGLDIKAHTQYSEASKGNNVSDPDLTSLLTDYRNIIQELSDNDIKVSSVVPSPTTERKKSSGIIKKFKRLPNQQSYGRAVHALNVKCGKEKSQIHPQYEKADGSLIYRAVSVKEFAEVVVNASLEDKLYLLSHWTDFCTGIVNKKRSNKFKIIPYSQDLIEISETAKFPLNVDYSSFKTFPELDSGKKGQIYGKQLTPAQIPENDGWIHMFEEDINLLKGFRDSVIEVYAHENDVKPKTLMGFYLRENTSNDELRPLFVYSFNDNCLADDYCYDGSTSLLQVTQLETP